MKKLILLAIAVISTFSLFGQTNNAVIENIMSRRSVRKYTEQSVDRSILTEIVNCGLNAPNAMNQQAWEVRIVDNKNYFKELSETMKGGMPNGPAPAGAPAFVPGQAPANMPAGAPAPAPRGRALFGNAPAVIFVACPDDKDGMTLLNVGLLSENICLAAKSLGLGTCVMVAPVVQLNSSEAAKPFLEKLGFSEGYKLRVVITIGYPNEEPAAKPRDLSKAKFVD